MRWFLTVAFFFSLVACDSPTSSVDDSSLAFSGGYDELGFNWGARHFNGPADGWDGVLDGTLNGDPTFAGDRLNVKWNGEYARGLAEGWANVPYYGAVVSSTWNGKGPDGSGYVWHYKIEWYGPCGFEGAPIASGGACTSGQFRIYRSHGTTDQNRHFHLIHVKRTK